MPLSPLRTSLSAIVYHGTPKSKPTGYQTQVVRGPISQAAATKVVVPDMGTRSFQEDTCDLEQARERESRGGVCRFPQSLGRSAVSP